MIIIGVIIVLAAVMFSACRVSGEIAEAERKTETENNKRY